MTEKEKEQKALEIYQQLMHTLADIADKEGVIEIVNTLIDENGLSSPVGGKESALSTRRKRSGDDGEASPCPRCGCADVVKNGSAHGKSRFRCKGCGSYFGPTTGKVAEGSSRSSRRWGIFIEGMLSGDSLPILSEKCGIALSTAHNWRMKLFSQVSNSTEGRILRGVIQEDEFYLASSFKGNWKGALNLGIEKDYSQVQPDYVKYGFRPHPHKRGSQDSRRGLNRDKSKTESCKGRYNLQLVNALHSVISEISRSRSCFATKNAEAYITWEAWKLLNRTKNLAEKKEILKSFSTPGKRTVTVQEIRARDLPEILHKPITT